MLFDEPLSNLDVRLHEQMQQEIHRLHQELGFTAIYVTHDQNEALCLSDNIAVINQGTIEQVGKPMKILTRPASPFVADFFGYSNRWSDAKLIDDQHALVGGIKIPIGYIGQSAQTGSKGVLLLRRNAVQVIDYDEMLKRMDRAGDDFYEAKLEIVAARYLGGETELKLRINNEGEHFTTTYPKLINPLPTRGQRVRVRFEPSAIAFFKSDRRGSDLCERRQGYTHG